MIKRWSSLKTWKKRRSSPSPFSVADSSTVGRRATEGNPVDTVQLGLIPEDPVAVAVNDPSQKHLEYSPSTDEHRSDDSIIDILPHGPIHDRAERIYEPQTLYEFPKIVSQLQALDDDCLYLVLVTLCYTEVIWKLKNIWPLSLTCKRLRAVCLPFMFKRVVWPNKRIEQIYEDYLPMLPWNLLPHIRNFRFHYDENDRIDDLIEAIPEMTRLTTFSIHTLSPPQNGLINALFAHPSLADLSFEETPLYFPDPLTPSHSLRTLQFKDGRDLRVSGSPQLFMRSWRESPGRTIYEKLEFERRTSDVEAATRLISAHCVSIEQIELTSGLTSVSHLTNFKWPLLQTLTLSGPCPAADDVPILQFLRVVPGLKELHILYSGRHAKSKAHAWYLCPPHPTRSESDSPTLTLAACLPNLRALTLSNPNALDEVFCNIPRSLESLVLPSIREWPNLTKGVDHPFAFRILRDVSHCGVRLRELRLYVNSEPSTDLISAIARQYPTLEVLYLGIDVFPYPVGNDINIALWERCADALVSLSALRELYLGLALPQSVPLEVYAPFFSNWMPNLKVVGLQQVDVSAFYRPARVQWHSAVVEGLSS